MLSLEQNYHYERGINLEIYSKVTHNMESDINFIKKIIDMVKNYNESLRENKEENMQNIELSKEEMSVIYDMRAKESEEKKLKTSKTSFERKNDTVYMHYIDENGKKQYNCSYAIDTNLLFEILTELQRKNNGNT